MMEAHPDLSDERRNALLQSLTAVGLSKPIGYLPLYTIEKFLRLSPEALADDAAKRCLATVQFDAAACCIKSGALYAYHRQALASVLQENAATVRAAGLPLDPDEFVSQIATVWFEEQHLAYPVIAAAFGDKA
ncbi:hypothetical protein E0H38_19525 [Rhizobium leguminosarum bv. viciae]|uniref:hypothetical protein n=1 Tax=Rhizobium leguminosarum TaxID=384 RepID=UPI0010E4829B|nr:hypothetical protein [Rhizobium leguminosarum]MBY5771985.1 hypothetical protein [Rhizobium leguminosarum]TBZ15263.1 hypothetical protein E0H38_19525 [Rhizobium leguminosarum bv. viciae]